MYDHVNVVIAPLPQPLTYGLPAELRSKVKVGSLVTVPLGKRQVTGYVVKTVEKPASQQYEIKNVADTDLGQICFPEEQLPFFEWIADYYCEPLSNVLDVAIPNASTRRVTKFLSLNNVDFKMPRGTTQKALIEKLQASTVPLEFAQLARDISGLGPVVTRLVNAGIVKVTEELAPLGGLFQGGAAAWAKTEVSLSVHQVDALNKINQASREQRFEPFCLRGVTGSGKTEVYIEAIREVLAQGKSAIVIVPEIALTPQVIERFRARIASPLAVLHSGLSKRDRWEAWLSLLEGESRLAIGARSAIFAPLKQVGLIIVDEEHDSSYKQAEGLRYHARDLAVVRAKLSNCPVILGSATPSIETYHNCLNSRYTELILPDRFAERQQLQFQVVDLTKCKSWEMASENISLPLAKELDLCIKSGQQAFILYNKRGFASFLQCDSCGAAIQCPNCSVTLTFHQHSNALVCHYCSFTRPAPVLCTKCSVPDSLKQRGAGTERVFDELKNLFPGTAIDRLDRDSASNIDDFERILNQVRTGQTQVLVGTQMIAKGHDLPNVTLVGVVDCDVGLNFPDFRAAERVFQLLTQCAGRAGRGAKAGRVVLQTRVPSHPALARTKADDYLGFVKLELGDREALRYPPFARMLRIVLSSTDKNLPVKRIQELKETIVGYIEDQGLAVSVLGPAPAPMVKVKAMWRHHLLLKSASVSALQSILHQFKSYFAKDRQLRVVFDVDPQDLM